MTKTASQQRTKTDFLCLTISAGGGRPELWDTLSRYGYTVTVKSDATGRTIRFDYHDSAHRYDQGIDQLDRDNLLEAFRCFVSDAEAGEASLYDFCADFGYDEHDASCARTWKACRRAGAKFARLFHDDREPSWVLEQLAAVGVE